MYQLVCNHCSMKIVNWGKVTQTAFHHFCDLKRKALKINWAFSTIQPHLKPICGVVYSPLVDPRVDPQENSQGVRWMQSVYYGQEFRRCDQPLPCAFGLAWIFMFFLGGFEILMFFCQKEPPEIRVIRFETSTAVVRGLTETIKAMC